MAASSLRPEPTVEKVGVVEPGGVHDGGHHDVIEAEEDEDIPEHVVARHDLVAQVGDAHGDDDTPEPHLIHYLFLLLSFATIRRRRP